MYCLPVNISDDRLSNKRCFKSRDNIKWESCEKKQCGKLDPIAPQSTRLRHRGMDEVLLLILTHSRQGCLRSWELPRKYLYMKWCKVRIVSQSSLKNFRHFLRQLEAKRAACTGAGRLCNQAWNLPLPLVFQCKFWCWEHLWRVKTS